MVLRRHKQSIINMKFKMIIFSIKDKYNILLTILWICQYFLCLNYIISPLQVICIQRLEVEPHPDLENLDKRFDNSTL